MEGANANGGDTTKESLHSPMTHKRAVVVLELSRVRFVLLNLALETRWAATNGRKLAASGHSARRRPLVRAALAAVTARKPARAVVERVNFHRFPGRCSNKPKADWMRHTPRRVSSSATNARVVKVTFAE